MMVLLLKVKYRIVNVNNIVKYKKSDQSIILFIDIKEKLNRHYSISQPRFV